MLLGITMLIAIADSDNDHGDVIASLTLAPALLLALAWLIARALKGREIKGAAPPALRTLGHFRDGARD